MSTPFAIIAIGRNEGERLRRCLASAVVNRCPVIYVDSASSDGSVGVARELGAAIVDLDMSLPFSAARARNAGFARLIEIAPDTQYVQFIDGDCELVAGWIDRARQSLDEQADLAAVCGRRRERFPDRSIYNRLADVEWNTPVGEAKSCGGDAMIRASALQQVGGYDPSVVAGEEPELCQRLRAAGWKILRIDAEMTLHDSAMLHWRQWWKRAVRSGYGAADVATRFGQQGLFVSQVRSARWWAVRYPILLLAWIGAGILLACFVPMIASPRAVDSRAQSAWKTRGAIIVIVLLLGLAPLPLQIFRTATKMRRRAGGWKIALAYGFFAMVGKWANAAGQRQYARDRRAGRHLTLIEYKSDPNLSITSGALTP